MKVSVIIPVLNEAGVVETCLSQKALAEADEVIVVDGGSTDETIRLSQNTILGERVQIIVTQPGRALQMNAGALASAGDVFVFLHADCVLPDHAVLNIRKSLERSKYVGGGFFKKYSDETPALALYRIVINFFRTWLLHNLVGTNAIFVRAELFRRIGGFPEWPILEDVGFCDLMKKYGDLAIINSPVVTSSRRYYKSGIMNRMFAAVKIIFLFRFFSISPEKLKSIYLNSPGDHDI